MGRPELDLVRQLVEGLGFSAETVHGRREQLEAATGALPPPEGVAIELVEMGGRPAEWLYVDGEADDRVLLYLHGGAYTAGSLNTHRALGGALAKVYGGRVLTLDYRLAPEGPFPAAIDDVVAAYRELLDSGCPSGAIAIGGDSAGGGLTAASLLAIRDRGLALPAAAFMLSPWTDLTLTSDTWSTRAEADFFLERDAIADSARHYLGDTPADDPLASPVFADLAGLPPLLIHVGDAEVLLDDSRTFAERASAAGVEVDLEVYDEMIHVFRVFPPEMLPETGDSQAKIAAFLNRHLD